MKIESSPPDLITNEVPGTLPIAAVEPGPVVALKVARFWPVLVSRFNWGKLFCTKRLPPTFTWLPVRRVPEKFPDPATSNLKAGLTVPMPTFPSCDPLPGVKRMLPPGKFWLLPAVRTILPPEAAPG